MIRLRKGPFTLALVAALATGPAAVAAIELRGRVVDEAGRPIARALVELSPVQAHYESFADILEGRVDPEPVTRVKTSRDGRYSVEAPKPGMWQVHVRARGKIPIRRRFLPLTESLDLADATLRADASLEFLVRDEAGEPVEGAQVWTRSLERPRGFRRRSEWRDQGRFGITDGDGMAKLSRAKNEDQDVRAWAPGFAVPNEGTPIKGSSGELSLRPARTVLLDLRGPTGVPADGAIFTLGGDYFVGGSAGEEGRIQVSVESGRATEIEIVLADGTSFTTTVERTEHQLANPAPRPERIDVPAATEWTGAVLGQDDREPIPDAFVWSRRDPGHFARSDAKGIYRISLSKRTDLAFRAGAAGYRSARAELSAGSSAEGPTLVLPPAARITGRVVDEEGSAIPDAQVVATLPQRWNHPQSTTRADGTFGLTGLDPKGTYELLARAPGFAPSRQSARPGPDADVEIVLQKGRALVGTVIDESGESVAGAEVHHYTVETDLRRRFTSPDNQDTLPPTFTAADGTFRVEGLGSKPVGLLILSPGFASKTVSGIEGEVNEPVVDAGEIVLVAGTELRGVVKNENGGPIEGATIRSGSRMMFRQPLQQNLMEKLSPTATSGPDGTFVLADLAGAQPIDLWADRKGYLDETVSGVVPGGEDPVEIVLERAARLSGRVLDPERRPVGGAMVQVAELEPGEGLTSRFPGFSRLPSDGRTREDGSFELDRAPAGRLEIKAQARGFLASESIEIRVAKGGEKAGLELVLRHGAELPGSVRDDQGQPIAGARVMARPATTGFGVRRMMSGGASQTESDGEFTIAGLEPGEINLSVHHEDYARHEETFDFRPGLRRDVVLESGATVSGRVLDEAGDPVAGAEVVVTDSARGFARGPSSHTLEDGSFEVLGVTSGTYLLTGSKPGYASTTSDRPFEVAASPVRGLTLHLKEGGTIRGQISGLAPELLEHVQVWVTGTEQRMPAMGLVDSEGEYRVANVVFERGTVAARSVSTGQSVEEPFELDTNGGEAWIDLKFRSGVTILGQVRLDDEPWRGAQVSAEGGPSSTGFAQTDQEGRFEIHGLASGEHKLTVSHRLGGRHTEYVDVAGDTRVQIDVESMTVSGRVVDALTGEPIEAAMVQVESSVPSLRGNVAGRTSTSSRGEFDLRLTGSERYTLRAQASGYSEQTAPVPAGGSGVQGLVLELEPAEALILRLRTWSGIQPAYASFAVVDKGRRVWAGWDRAVDGVFRLRSVPAGEWTLMIQAENSAITSVPIRAPGDAGEITLGQGSILSVDLSAIAERAGLGQLRVLASDGRPLLQPGRDLTEVWPVRGLRTFLEGIPAGEWIVEYSDVSGAVWRRAVNARAGETVDVALE